MMEGSLIERPSSPRMLPGQIPVVATGTGKISLANGSDMLLDREAEVVAIPLSPLGGRLDFWEFRTPGRCRLLARVRYCGVCSHLRMKGGSYGRDVQLRLRRL